MKKFLIAILVGCLFALSSCSFQDENLKSLRNTWSRYIYYQNSQYQFSALGGIDAFDVPIQNDTDYIIDEVKVRVTYLKQSGKIFKTEDLVLFNIPPHSLKTGKAPNSNRGTSVELTILSVQSRDMKLCVPSNGIEMSDPYRCF